MKTSENMEQLGNLGTFIAKALNILKKKMINKSHRIPYQFTHESLCIV